MEENRRSLRCAIYTRKSTEEGLEQEFNTLQAQREAAEAYSRSQHLPGGSQCRTCLTTVVSAVQTWIGRRSRSSSVPSRRDEWIAFWCIKSIG